MYRRLREQARSHNWIGYTRKSRSAIRPPREQALLPHRFLVVYRICVHRRALWESSLLAIAVGLLASMLNVPPSSRASPLPHRFLVAYRICVHRRALWESSLLAIAVGLLASMLNVPPSSRASFAPTQVFGRLQDLCPPPSPVGAELARDSGGPACINAECTAVFASKPAPTQVFGRLQDLCPPPSPVGAELARDSGGPACINAECTAVFASKPAPTGETRSPSRTRSAIRPPRVGR